MRAGATRPASAGAAEDIGLTDGHGPGSRRGFFISFEGLDGAGKSTQVAGLAGALRADGRDVVVVRPSDTGIGDLVRGFLLQHQVDVPVDPWAEALLFIASRVQLLRETVIPALERGAVVIADRYADSTLAYQGGGRGLSMDLLLELHRNACADTWPDLTFLLELPVDEAQHRQRAAELPIDRFESEANRFHSKVAATFDDLAERHADRFVRINAGRPAVQVSEEIGRVARERLVASGRAMASAAS